MRSVQLFVCPILIVLLMSLSEMARAQACQAIGQNPASAFPVCGTQTFEQKSVPICGYKFIPGPACNNPDDGIHQDKNPYWYKFTCYKTGTLGFTIVPKQQQDDYDWQLFDITGHNPNDVYTDTSLYVFMNWSGESGNTGASSAGTLYDVCGGYGWPLFSKMATIIAGHQYLLLISHFSNNQSGYELTFGGGTAIITDPNIPHVDHANYHCGPYAIGIKLNKSVKCASLAPDGSDFSFTAAGNRITGVTGIGCSNGFDFDSLTLQLDHPLAPGTYTITSQTGSDQNTLLDACGNALPAGEQLTFTVPVTLPVPMGPIKAFPCGPDQLQLEFQDGIQCSSISPDGKDFLLSGPSPAKIIGASGSCNSNGLTWLITLQLDQHIIQAGNYVVTLVPGPDGNTVESECWQETPAGSSQPFTIAPQPALLLNDATAPGCTPTTLKFGVSVPVRCSSIAADGSDFTINGPVPVSILKATGNCDNNGLADSITLQLSAPIYVGGNYQITLTAGSDGNTLLGECWQPAAPGQQVNIRTADTVSAAFSYTLQQNCRITTMQFFHNGLHGVNQWQWNFDDGDSYTLQYPVKVYETLGNKHITLTVSNGVCSDTQSKDTLLRSEVTALFDVSPGPYCPMDLVLPVNKSLGEIKSYSWDYGNGATTKGATPVPMQYYPTQKEQQYLIRLIVANNVQCQDTADHYIQAVSSCYIDVPTAFSPNGDGQNDYLYPLNAYKAVDLHFAIYNRVGNLLFETTDWRIKWDGTLNGKPSDIGTYVWMLEYTEKESGKRVFRKGTTVLLR
ncbi:gliding motility-associated C-terminal domain-containing protein [Chitinophaga sp. 30R24]|uniref:T9SS type B sorting domain-containing protein n=1 Tax=Chitinophaga sp. 30R24 TaxID=3248838 RepID=UPI003B8FDC57